MVRKLCEKCRYQTKVSADTLKTVKKQLSPELITKFKLDKKTTKLYYGKGCSKCQDTGFSGRIGIFEILPMNEEIKQLIMDKKNASLIKAKAVEQGMLPMIEDGLQKMKDGITTIDEILRVTRE